MKENNKIDLISKDWNNIKTNDSWQIFKIMSEFVEGFERLAKIGPCVSIFGSARTKPENNYYKLAEELAYQLTLNKYGVITWNDVRSHKISNDKSKIVIVHS